jgi:hypothetical protein
MADGYAESVPGQDFTHAESVPIPIRVYTFSSYRLGPPKDMLSTQYALRAWFNAAGMAKVHRIKAASLLI